MDEIHVVVRDDRECADGDERNIAAYVTESKAREIVENLNAIVAGFKSSIETLARRGKEDVTEEFRALSDQVAKDLNAIIPHAGVGYSNFGVIFRVNTLDLYG